MNKITYRICLHLGEISEKNHLLPIELLKWLCSLIRMVLGDYNHLKVVSVQNHLFQNKWAFHFLGLSAEVGRPCFLCIPSPQGLQCSDYNHWKFTLNCKWPPHIVSKWQWLYTIQLFICVSYDWQISASNFQWRHNGLRWCIKLMQNTPTASLFYCRARVWLHRQRVCHPSGSSWS